MPKANRYSNPPAPPAQAVPIQSINPEHPTAPMVYLCSADLISELWKGSPTSSRRSLHQSRGHGPRCSTGCSTLKWCTISDVHSAVELATCGCPTISNACKPTICFLYSITVSFFSSAICLNISITIDLPITYSTPKCTTTRRPTSIDHTVLSYKSISPSSSSSTTRYIRLTKRLTAHSA